MLEIQGLGASSGIAIGKVWVYQSVDLKPVRRQVDDVPAEQQRFREALQTAEQQLQQLEKQALETIGQEEAAIFEAHQLFLQDPDLIESVQAMMDAEQINADAAVYKAVEQYASQLEMLDDEYFAARAADVRDVGNRILRCLLGFELGHEGFPSDPVIVVADDLTPSDTIQFDKDYVLGIITVRGGPTSHTAILARSLGIPAVVSARIKLKEGVDGETAVLNGQTGAVIISPTAEKLEAAQAEYQTWQGQQQAALATAMEHAVTKDGQQVEIVANVGGKTDAEQALKFGAEGVGLFRTEFLYLDRDSMPTEEEQIEAYSAVFSAMGDRPIVVRTLDIGGDKAVSYLGLTAEPNPFLGWRAIRMIDERPDILHGQFRALLQAGVGHDLRIMLPLVSQLDELLEAQEILNQARQSLEDESLAYNQEIQFGIMVEVPSVALIADLLAPHVDFFSIGTNDLTQYTLAVDRMNERVARLGSPYNPAVLRLINMTIEAAHKHGKWVGLCGAFGGDPQAVPLLLGMGLDEFSMAPSMIPEVKETIRKWQMSEAKAVAQQALMSNTTNDVKALVKSAWK